MSASSYLMLLEEVASDPYAADDSVSTMRAWATRNNLAHLIDESTQVRINWVATSVNGSSNDSYKLERYAPEDVVTDASVKRIWSQEFPITWIRADRPVNLDLHIRAATTGDTTPTLHLRARIVPARFPIGDPTCPVFVEEQFDAVLDATPVVSVNEQLQLTAPAPELECYQDLDFIYEQDGVQSSPRMTMMRLEISLDEYTTVEDAVHEIVSVYLREYA